MALIRATIEQVGLENADGYPVGGVQATCSLCNHETTSFGTSSRSVKRCLYLLRDECPYGKEEAAKHFYKCAGPFYGDDAVDVSVARRQPTPRQPRPQQPTGEMLEL